MGNKREKISAVVLIVALSISPHCESELRDYRDFLGYVKFLKKNDIRALQAACGKQSDVVYLTIIEKKSSAFSNSDPPASLRIVKPAKEKEKKVLVRS